MRTLLKALAFWSFVAAAFFANAQTKGTVAAYPWAFVKGNETPKETALKTVGEIAQQSGFAVVTHESAAKAWKKLGLPEPDLGKVPTVAQLRKFSSALDVKMVYYGKVTWHTRSIWVGAGAKTISTATVMGYVYDRKTNKVVFKHSGTGRSDEKEDALKVAGAVLLTPLVTAISGGPSTPREQRAVQIALARAYQGWTHAVAKAK